MPKRIELRRFHRGEKQLLNIMLHDRKLPVWQAQRYRLIALVYQGLSVRAASRRLTCAKETAYRWVNEFNHVGFRQFNRTSHPEGRPSQFAVQDLKLLFHIAQKRPTDVGLPFTHWSMTKLHAYLVKQRHFPKVSPEWLRRQLRRAKISWQRTKTWKQSHDPQFKAKKSVFWHFMPSVPNVALSSVTINLDRLNYVRLLDGVGHGSVIRNGIAPLIPANAGSNSCTGSMTCMPTAWSDGSANGKRAKTLSPVSNACGHAIQSNYASIS
jgi:transposase